MTICPLFESIFSLTILVSSSIPIVVQIEEKLSFASFASTATSTPHRSGLHWQERSHEGSERRRISDVSTV